MCLCLFAVNAHEEYPFVLLANRDEFRKRTAAKAAFWDDKPNVLAGRDLEGMGTWLGINKQGKITFLTNYRDPKFFNRKGPTRGTLVSNFLSGETDGESYLRSIENPEAFNGFNLVVGTAQNLHYYSNVEDNIIPIEDGVHGLSNAFLNSSWPKVDSGKEELLLALKNTDIQSDSLFSILHSPLEAKDDTLPETGVGVELERKLSSRFINMPEYGTVCSTVVLVDRNGKCTFEERTFNHVGEQSDVVKHHFQLKL